MFTFVGDIPCKTCAKNKLERSSKSQKTRYLSTASKDLSTDTNSQKVASLTLPTDATSPKIKSSGRPAPVDSNRAPVDRCTQSEPSAFWFFTSCLRLSIADARPVDRQAENILREVLQVAKLSVSMEYDSPYVNTHI